MQPGQATSSTPIRIGYCLLLSGAVGGNVRAARLAHQIWLEAINARGGLLGRLVELVCHDDGSDAASAASSDTVMGTVRFGVHGEWTEPRVVQVQYQGIDSHDPMQFLDDARQVVVAPASMRSGTLICPYADADADAV